MKIDVSQLTVGGKYDRDYLATAWGAKARQALQKGIVTASGQAVIAFLITEKNEATISTYSNFYDGELLWMDGEVHHHKDNRLQNSLGNDTVYLFYRKKARQKYVYCGEAWLLNSFIETTRPSRFLFATNRQIVDEFQQPPDVPGDPEGAKRLRLHTVYERSKKNRDAALQIHGRKCSVCEFDFNAFYGEDLARAYIEIHHTRSITEIRGEVVTPRTDLAPLCANCHRMAHRRSGEIIPLDELMRRVRERRVNT